MKIALVHQPTGTISPSFLGGSMRIWTYEVARRLARSCDVIVYTKKDRHQKKDEYDQGVHYRRISTAADEWFNYISTAIDKLGRFPRLYNVKRALFFRNVRRPLFASSLYHLTYALQVAKDLRAEKCDIVHIQNFSQFVPVFRAFNPKIKIVLDMRCEWLTQLDRAMIESRLREVDLVIGVSRYITEKIRRCFPQFAKRCQTVFTGIDINHYVNKNGQTMTKKNDVKRLLFVGRVSPEKGLHVLLDAFQKVVERYPQAQLEIVGPQGSAPIEFIAALSDDDKVSNLASFYYRNFSSRGYFSHLQRRVLSLKISSHVTFSGFVPYVHVINHYRNADVLVNPSLSESFGRSLIEAMACQVPVVATRVGGMAEIVEDGKTGILVEPGDAQELAEAIIRLFSDEGLRRSMGEAARKRAVELYSWEKIVENLLCQYKNIRDGNG